jgi:uncharacterized protein YgiB involved in biofilm formation
MRRRSKKVALSIVGATAFTLAGCAEEQIDAQAFPDLPSCVKAAESEGLFSTEECRLAVAEAQTLHVESAPRYDSLTVCEEQHGKGACGTEQAAAEGGSGSIFMPLLAGYLIGNMMRGTGGLAASQPMYRTAGGRFATPGGTTYSGNSGRGQLGAGQFARPPATRGLAPMTRATVASRGGFGRSNTGRRSYGG